MTLGETIRGLREQVGLTQTDVAAELGVTAQAVQQWEADETAPRGQRLFALIRLLEKKGVRGDPARSLFQAAAERAKGRALASLPISAGESPSNYTLDSVAMFVSSYERADEATKALVRVALGIGAAGTPEMDRAVEKLVDAAKDLIRHRR